MCYPMAELLGRVERRRRFSVEQKLAVRSEATAPGDEYVGGRAPARAGPYPGIQVAPLGRTRGIGVPGASELPSFVSVEITKDAPSLPAVVPTASPPWSMTRRAAAAQEVGADRD